MSGMERQPSSAFSFLMPCVEMILGLMRVNLLPSTSTTATLSLRPTCGAARPMPSAAYIVSNMSAMSLRNSSVTSMPAVGDDLIALLEIAHQLVVLLALSGLWPDENEVEDREDRSIHENGAEDWIAWHM